MATTYSGGPLVVNGITYTREDQPAVLITNSSPTFRTNPFENLTLRISGDGGASWVIIGRAFPPIGPVIPANIDAVITALNNTLSGTAPNNIEWFIPKTTASLNALQIGVRTKTYTGPNALLQVVSGTAVNPAGFNWDIGQLSRGVEGFTRLLQKPDPGDPFTGLSVDLYKTGLRSRSLHMVNKLSRSTDSNGRYSARSLNGTTIDLYPISGVEFDYTVLGVKRPLQVTDSSTRSLTNANLSPPGNFVANTWYYIYAWWFPGNILIKPSLSFEISTSPPDSWKLYKTGDTSRKYLFAFRTDGMGNIIPFIRDGYTTRYLSGNRILTAASAAMDTVVDASAFIPPTSRLGLIRIFADNTALAANTYVYLKPDPVTTVDGRLLGIPQNFYIDDQIWVVSGTNQKYLYSTPVMATKITLDVWGFIE